MKVVDVILADYAAIDGYGKFTLVGAGFTEIAAKSIPCTHALIFILIRLQVVSEDVGAHTVGLKIVGEKGSIFNANMTVNIGASQTQRQTIPLAARIVNLKFENQGIYNIDVTINGHMHHSSNLTIRKIQDPDKKG